MTTASSSSGPAFTSLAVTRDAHRAPQPDEAMTGREHMSAATHALEQWLRGRFVELNTALDETYFAERVEIAIGRPRLKALRRELLADGARLVAQVADEDELPDGFTARYRLLGAVGFYLAACRRHEIEDTKVLAPAWSLATTLGSPLGVAPRYVFAHQATHNLSIGGSYRTFTSLADERLFIDGNALGVLAYKRAADALRRIPELGVSSPIVNYLLEGARDALGDVLGFNRRLGEQLDVDRFFFNIRPYFKPHRVGDVQYRGVNAGDFAEINEIDLLLGLCQPTDPFYKQLVEEKQPYLPPEDQALLRTAVTRASLLDAFLAEASTGNTPQLRRNARLFLEVCRAHGAAYTYHHRLVRDFLVHPAQKVPADRRDDLTASGPPLEVVVEGLARLRDLRTARDRPGQPSAHASLERLHTLTLES